MVEARSDVVVIGAGVIGCSVAVHLLEAGVRNVIVIERDDVGQGTSNAGAGFVGEWAGGWDRHLGPEELEIERYGLGFYATLAESGYQFDHRTDGNLYLAGSKEAYDRDCVHLLRAVTDAQALSPEEIATATSGVVAADRVVAGVLHPSGGQVSAAHAARAMAQRYRDGGGRLRTREPVRRILARNGRVFGVETTSGTIPCDHVVLAAGAWANILLRPLGLFLPFAPLVAFRVVTEPLGIPGTLPTLMMREPGFYAREHHGGLLWGAMYTAPPRNAFVEVDPPDRFDQLPLDGYLEMREGRERAVAEIVPALGRARSATLAFGAPTYTPDGRALLGKVPGIDGLVVASGCNEGGVTHGPGFGRLVAELIVDGEPTLCSVNAFAVDRFGDRYASTAEVAVTSSY